MKKEFSRAATSLLALVACYFLVKRAYTGQDLGTILGHVQKVDLIWVTIILLCTIAGHCVRTLRWQMLLKACGKEVTFIKLFAALLSGYFVNQALPRVGELLRSYLLNRSDKISYGTSIGSVVAERLIDTVCLVLLLLSCLVFIGDLSFAFFESHIHHPLQNYFGEMPFWKIGALLLGVTALLYFIIERSQKKNKVHEQASEQTQTSALDEFADESWQGIAAVTKVENKALFWTYTILIWVLYFLMTYLWFFSLEETKHLGIKEAVFIWAIGNIGRMVPTQGGGAGAYHYLVIQAFLLFGISNSVAGAMALLIHGLQTGFYIVVGSICLVAYMALTSDTKKTLETESQKPD